MQPESQATTESDTAPTPAPYDRRLANEFVAALEAGKAAYARADDAMRRLHNRNAVGSKIQLKDGRTVELVDNFADSNVTWKPAGVKRFDGKIHKPRKARTARPKAKRKPKAKPKAKPTK